MESQYPRIGEPTAFFDPAHGLAFSNTIQCLLSLVEKDDHFRLGRAIGAMYIALPHLIDNHLDHEFWRNHNWSASRSWIPDFTHFAGCVNAYIEYLRIDIEDDYAMCYKSNWPPRDVLYTKCLEKLIPAYRDSMRQQLWAVLREFTIDQRRAFNKGIDFGMHGRRRAQVYPSVNVLECVTVEDWDVCMERACQKTKKLVDREDIEI